MTIDQARDQFQALRVWPEGVQHEPAVTDIVDARPRATVMDLGGFSHPDEANAAALSVLTRLWANREHDGPC